MKRVVNLSGMEILFILLTFERLRNYIVHSSKTEKMYANITNKLRAYIYFQGGEKIG